MRHAVVQQLFVLAACLSFVLHDASGGTIALQQQSPACNSNRLLTCDVNAMRSCVAA